MKEVHFQLLKLKSAKADREGKHEFFQSFDGFVPVKKEYEAIGRTDEKTAGSEAAEDASLCVGAFRLLQKNL